MSMEAALQEKPMQPGTYEVVKHMRAILDASQRITATSEQIALVTITLQFASDSRLSAYHHNHSRTHRDQERMDASTRYLLENLRPLVRKTDMVFLHMHTFHFIIINAGIAAGQLVQERLWDALLWRIHNPSENELLRPASVQIGYSAYAVSTGSLEQCFAEAGEARASFTLQPARRAIVQQKRMGKESDLPQLARKLGVPYLPLLPRKSPQQVEQLVNPRLAQELRCYPLGRERGTLTVAVSDPQDHATLDRLQRETGLHIFPVLTPSYELQTVLDQLI